MVKCLCCSYSLAEGVANICIPCRNTKGVTMSKSEAKKTFLLTQEDLDDDSLISFETYCGGRVCKKYITKQLEKYSKNKLKKDKKYQTKVKKREELEGKKHLEKIRIKKREEEIDKLMKNKKIQNINDDKIKILRDEFIVSNVTSLDDTINKIIHIDDDITMLTKQKNQFVKNIIEIIRERFTENFLAESLKEPENVILSYVESKSFENFWKNVEQSVWYYHANNFTELLSTKENIIKTEYHLKVIPEILKQIGRDYRTFRINNELKEISIRNYLCNDYIAHGIDGVKTIEHNIKCFEDIVESIREEFYYKTKTQYDKLYKLNCFKMRIRDFRYISQKTKEQIVGEFNTKNIIGAPKNVVELFNKINNIEPINKTQKTKVTKFSE